MSAIASLNDARPVSVFCISCAGGSAAPYFRWRVRSPSSLRIVPLERPGRGMRFQETGRRAFQPLAEELAASIAAGLEGDYVLFGHSLGALLAYECAHLLRQAGHSPPLGLVLACCAAPECHDLERYSRHWSDAELAAEMLRLGGTPAEILDQPDLRQLALAQLADDFAICGDFRHDPGRTPLDVPFYIYGGIGDQDVGQDALSAWRGETRGDTIVRLMAGGHFFFYSDPDEILGLLDRDISALLAAGSDSVLPCDTVS